MTDQQKQEAKSRINEYIALMGKKPVPNSESGSKTGACPVCNKGHDTPCAGIMDHHYLKCFSCGFGGDIFDLIGRLEGIPDQAAQFKRAEEIFHFTGTSPRRPAPEEDFFKQGKSNPGKEIQAEEPAPAGQPDQREYYRQWQADAGPAIEYLVGRGIDQELLKTKGIGYDRSRKAAIIPITDSFYIARSIEGKRFMNPAGAAVMPYNLAAMNQDKPVFIVEGVIDALSIETAGGQAIAIHSTANAGRLAATIRRAKQDRILPPFIIALDNDESGRTAAAELKKDLDQMGALSLQGTITGKDPNAALQAGRAKLEDEIKVNIKEAEEKEKAAPAAATTGTAQSAHEQGTNPLYQNQPNLETALTSNLVSGYLKERFHQDIERFGLYKDRKTGFENLDQSDKAGGLYPGLYVLGAVSSLGKTTFIHQMADQLAAMGDHVLFFSLEQNRLEMVTKSLARIMARDYGTKDAVTALSIRKGYHSPVLADAIEDYKDIAQRVSVIECNFNINIYCLIQYVEDFIKTHKIRPIVVIDYLQIIPPTDPRQSDKEKVDNIVRGLKKLQSDNDLVVFVVSSLNRSNYLTPVDFESFKESGGIEYTADVVWGLQLTVMNDPIFAKERKLKEKREKVREAKGTTPRKIELLCLKNRYGISSYSCHFEYDPRFDYFKPDLNHQAEQDFFAEDTRL